MERNRFYQLGVGVWHQVLPQTNYTTYLKQNVFLNCRQGLLLGDPRFQCAGNYATAELSCNTYLRNDGGGRSGTMQGVRAAICVQTTLLNSNNITTGQGLLKEYFDNYKVSIGQNCIVPGLYGAGVNVYGPWNVSSTTIDSTPAINTCREDGYTDTGIQSRPSNAGAARATGKLTEVAVQQNAPNPATDETRIAYQLPSSVRQATLLVREGMSGREVLQQAVDPTRRELLLNLRSLPSGTYFYTIVADGIPARTLRLLVNRQ
jgi:hypothetical protein